MHRILTGFLLCVCCESFIHAADWPAFRGPHGNGTTSAVGIPVRWSAESGIAWRADLPGDCNGSPIISQGHVFVTSADSRGLERRLHCVDAGTGQSLWTQAVPCDREMPTHKTNRYAGTTPAASRDHVVVWHATGGLHCYARDGRPVWSQDLGEFRHQWGYGTSPVLLDNRVILHSGPGQHVFVAAYRLDDGTPLWRHDEPVEGDGESNAAGRYMGSWSTPIVAPIAGHPVVICSMATRVIGLNADTGELEWYCEGLRGDRGDLSYASPVLCNDICVAMGGYQGPAIGFRMQGRGALTSERLWRVDAGNPQRIGSAVCAHGVAFMLNAGPDTMQCIQPETGEILWEHRAPGSAHWGSLALAEGRLYSTDQNGTTHVLSPSTDGYELLASNPLHEPSNSTPAIADGMIVLRTFGHLWCVRSDKPADIAP